MKKLILAVLLMFVVLGGLTASPELSFSDYLLLAPAVVKTAIPLFMLADTFTDPEPTLILYASAGILLYSLPNALLIYNVFNENPGWTRVLRTASIFTDGGLAVFLAGYGVLLFTNVLNTGAGTDDIIGMLFIGMSIPVAVTTIFDFFQYSFEE